MLRLIFSITGLLIGFLASTPSLFGGDSQQEHQINQRVDRELSTVPSLFPATEVVGQIVLDGQRWTLTITATKGVSVHEQWTSKSMVTLTGSFRGTLTVAGLNLTSQGKTRFIAVFDETGVRLELLDEHENHNHSESNQGVLDSPLFITETDDPIEPPEYIPPGG